MTGFPPGAQKKGTAASPWRNQYMGRDIKDRDVIAKTCGTCKHMSNGICALDGKSALTTCDDWQK